MIKIGLVGGAKCWHGMTFAEMFNGFDRKEAIKRGWGPLYDTRVGKNAYITHIWDINRRHAQEVARICRIKNVVENMEDMVGRVDGVIIADDCTMTHQRRARPFLRTGIPTFIDKPLSPDIKEAEEIISLAKRYKTPLMSCSALRFAKETRPFRTKKKDIGEILTGFAVCKEWQGSLVFYGIHALELLYSIVGTGVKSVKNIGEKGKDIVILEYENRRRFILTAYEAIEAIFQISLYGTKGNCSITVSDSGYFYSEMLRQFVAMVRSGKETITLTETLEIIRVLVLAQKSTGGKSYAV